MSGRHTTGTERDRTPAACPSCERYIGPVGRCPYCGSDANRPRAMRALRAAALTLAGVGLLFLYLMVTHREVPLVKIGNITPVMNYATVRVAGTVARTPYISRRDGKIDYLSFQLDDRTGSVRVSAEGETADALHSDGRTPGRGQHLEITGRLNVRADGRCRLRIQIPEHVCKQ